MSPHRLGSAASITATILFAGLPISTAVAQLQVAEELLISLDASTYSNGAQTWVSTGTLPAQFFSFGTPLKVNDVLGTEGIILDGIDHFIGPQSTETLHGANATYSIETWVYNGHLRPEESLVTWGQRGGPDGTNVSFNYGNDSRWGAMGHWGEPDMGWGFSLEDGSDLTPEAGKWHHLVYTYDGAGTQRVYSDGVLTNEEFLPNGLDAKNAFALQIGAQREANNTIATANTLSGVLSKVRIHAGTLTGEQILNNYNFEKAQYPNDATPQLLEKGPVNRYTFNNLTSAEDLTVVEDVISGKNGEIRGPGASVVPGGVELPGGDQFSSYIDLPNGVISGTIDGGEAYESASYEAWVTVLGNNHWSRIMDFGSSGNGEVFEPGGAGNGTNFVFLSANVDSNDNMAMERGGGAGPGQRQSPGSQMFGTEIHVVLSYDAELQEWRWFQNGKLMESFFSDGGPGTITDVNNWLGRSNFGQDGNLAGMFNEFRIYDYALSQRQIIGNFLLGPEAINIPEPGSALLVALGATMLGLRRRRTR